MFSGRFGMSVSSFDYSSALSLALMDNKILRVD